MGVTRITLSIPTPQLTQLMSNLLGVAGLLAVVVAIGALAGNWWWSVLAGGIVACALAWVANLHAQAAGATATAGEEQTSPGASPTVLRPDLARRLVGGVAGVQG